MEEQNRYRKDSVSARHLRHCSAMCGARRYSLTVICQKYGISGVLFCVGRRQQDRSCVPENFLWQEGHTIHATYEEAEERTKQMWRVYRDFVQDVLAIPVVSGRKTESEKFAGAQDTYTIEALMHDGKALQSATSHFFGNGFPDAFGIKYVDKNNELHSAYETSWGWSTRSIGALIMVHGDDDGLVLPPHVAPVECRIIPIAQHKEGVLDRSYALLEN